MIRRVQQAHRRSALLKQQTLGGFQPLLFNRQLQVQPADTLARAHDQSPKRLCSIASTAGPAVSVLRMRWPRDKQEQPRFIKVSTSVSLKPPSGPMMTRNRLEVAVDRSWGSRPPPGCSTMFSPSTSTMSSSLTGGA